MTTGERLTIEPNWNWQIRRLVDDVDQHAGRRAPLAEGLRLRLVLRVAHSASAAPAKMSADHGAGMMHECAGRRAALEQLRHLLAQRSTA